MPLHAVTCYYALTMPSPHASPSPHPAGTASTATDPGKAKGEHLLKLGPEKGTRDSMSVSARGDMPLHAVTCCAHTLRLIPSHDTCERCTHLAANKIMPSGNRHCVDAGMLPTIRPARLHVAISAR